ncbi:hypothetical protein WMY93_010155 [Mugilogobius chulae]|uniref:Uncharacterized protein n=1 Tax=Mugilogobius chulae TaxID=88201 RepID=A0AAW0PCB1_9GOBI
MHACPSLFQLTICQSLRANCKAIPFRIWKLLDNSVRKNSWKSVTTAYRHDRGRRIPLHSRYSLSTLRFSNKNFSAAPPPQHENQLFRKQRLVRVVT